DADTQVEEDASAADNVHVLEDAEPREATENTGRPDDPVRMHLREMGNEKSLSREGELANAIRSEQGSEMGIRASPDSPMVMKEILSWRDGLDAGTVLLRDIIDLDATYGANNEDNSFGNTAAVKSDDDEFEDEDEEEEGDDEEEEGEEEEDEDDDEDN